MDWLDLRIGKKVFVPTDIWNNHWNNHVRFCCIIEPYMTFDYTIKNGDIGLLKHTMREVCIILQAPAALKPKYVKAMLRQIHIFDTVNGAASRLVSWSPITTISSAKRSAQRERTKLRVQGYKGRSRIGQGQIRLTKGGSRAKSCDEVWPRVDREQSPAMMFAQG